jgi:hypothetical protein
MKLGGTAAEEICEQSRLRAISVACPKVRQRRSVALNSLDEDEPTSVSVYRRSSIVMLPMSPYRVKTICYKNVTFCLMHSLRPHRTTAWHLRDADGHYDFDGFRCRGRQFTDGGGRRRTFR